MANITVSPDMSLPIPTPIDPGPDYANNINKALLIIDGHTHTGAPTDGLQLDLAKQTVQGDVQFNDHNVGTVRSVEFVSQPGNLTGTQDVNCLYVNQGVLGFNNASGIFVPLIGALSASFFNFAPQAVSTNYTIAANAGFNLVACTTTAGPITVTLPAAATIVPMPQWRLYLIYDVGEDAGTNAITIATAGGDTFAASGASSIHVNTDGGYVAIVTDGVSKWYVWDQSVYSAGETLALEAGSNIDMTTVNVTSASLSTSDNGSTFRLTDSNVQMTGVLAIGDSATSVSLSGSTTLASGATLDLATGSTTTVTGSFIVDSVPVFNSEIEVQGQAFLDGGISTNGTTLFYAPVSVNAAGGGDGSTTLNSVQYNHPLVRLTTTTNIGSGHTWTFIFPNYPTVPDGTTWMVDVSQTVGNSDPGTLAVQVGSLMAAKLWPSTAALQSAKTLWIVQVNQFSTSVTVAG